MQDPTGEKYSAFRQHLLGGRGQIDKARALAVAREVGVDFNALEADLASDEIKATLEESFKLAEQLGLNGTPSYVIGSDVVVGAVGVNALREKIKQARGSDARVTRGSPAAPDAPIKPGVGIHPGRQCSICRDGRSASDRAG